MLLIQIAQQVVSGLAAGAIYASLALALVMIYNSTNHINFSQGEMALLSTYFAWTLLSIELPYWLVFFLTIVVSFLFGVAVERLLIRRFHGAPSFSLVTVFIALLLGFNALATWIWGGMAKSFPSPVDGFSVGSMIIDSHGLFILTVMLVLVVLLYAFFRFTTLGLAMRAAALNPSSARLVGVRVDWMLSLGWGLAGALGAIAGMLIAPVVYLDPSTMLGVIMGAFAAAMLGGISSPQGAVAGGLIFGVLENIAGTYFIGDQMKTTFALVVVILVLLFKPAGLFGKTVVKRV